MRPPNAAQLRLQERHVYAHRRLASTSAGMPFAERDIIHRQLSQWYADGWCWLATPPHCPTRQQAYAGLTNFHAPLPPLTNTGEQ